MGRRTRLVAVNDRGHIIGEDHPRAKLSDEDVRLIRALHDEGLSAGVIARKFEANRYTIAKIVTLQRRAELPHRYVRAGGWRHRQQ